MADKDTRIVAGCMTGTSLDGLDVALVRIDGHGLEMKATLIGHRAAPMPDDLRATLMHLASGNAAEPIVYLRAARQLGFFHADVLAELFAQHSGDKPDFVTAHGQTIWHAPKDSADLGPMSWQLFDPWPIVQRHGMPVCYDLRQADLIAGGEGAPITPIADWVMYRGFDVVLNLGGICNATQLSSCSVEAICGMDVAPCNLLLNGLAQRLLGTPYDRDGQAALAGATNRRILKLLYEHAAPVRGAKSLGRETFEAGWEERLLALLGDCAVSDVLASAVEFIVELIGVFVRGIDGPGLHVVLAGGGVRNRALLNRLTTELEALGRVIVSDDLGIPCEAREAMGFAVLGALSQDGVPVSLSQVTGAKSPGVAGVWAGV